MAQQKIKILDNISNKKIVLMLDQFGYEISPGDLVLIENNLIHKQFIVTFNYEQLAFGFVSNDKAKTFYTMREIKGIFENYTITKTC